MDESKAIGSARPSLIRRIKARLVEFSVGLAAHYLRFFALAPIFAASTIALMMAGALTQTSDYLVPLFDWLLPESLQGDFSGGIMEFGLPIAWEYRALLFWIPIAIGIVEQLSGKRLRHVGPRAKLWLYALLPLFGVITLFTLLFLDINGSRITGSVIAILMNAFLLGSAMLGVGALMIISFAEDQLIKKLNGPKDTPTDS